MDTELVKKFNDTQSKIETIEEQIMAATVKLQTKLATLRTQDSELRAAMKEAMEKNNVKKFESDSLVITYIAPSLRKGLDTARLKEDAPGIYDKYLKETTVSSSIRIKVKETA